MKKQRKISLSQLNQYELDRKQQQLIFGGQACKCGSCGEWATSVDNRNANYNNGFTGTGSNSPECMCSDGMTEAVTAAIA